MTKGDMWDDFLLRYHFIVAAFFPASIPDAIDLTPVHRSAYALQCRCKPASG